MKPANKTLFICLVLIFGLAFGPLVDENIAKITPTVKAIEKILEVAQIGRAEIRVLAKLRTLKEITKAVSKYPPETRLALYLEIAKTRGIIKGAEAEEIFLNMKTVGGFENVVKLLCAADKANVKGAIYELRMANAATKRGYEVIKMRSEFFGDPNKRRTDIDLLLRTKSGKLVAMECKSYEGSVMSDMISKDSDTLLYYREHNPGVKLIFSFNNEPSKLAKKLLQDKGITPLWGDIDAQIKALELIV